MTVAVTGADGAVECTVTDSGPGLPANQLETVVERFTRSAANAPGTGAAQVSFALPGARGRGRSYADSRAPRRIERPEWAASPSRGSIEMSTTKCEAGSTPSGTT